MATAFANRSPEPTEVDQVLAEAAAAGPAAEAPVWSARLLGEVIVLELKDAIAIPNDRLEQVWLDARLPKELLPQKRGPIRAFKLATPKGQVAPAGHGSVGGYSFMPYHGPARVEGMQAAAVLIRSDDAAERVGKEHLELGIVLLDAADDVRFVAGRDLGQAPDLEPAALAYVETIAGAYRGYLGHANGKLCRKLVNRILVKAASLTYHAGVSVVPLRSRHYVDALEQVVGELDAWVPGGSETNTIHRIPYMDTARTREQVRNVLHEHVQAETARILQRTRDFVAEGGSLVTARGGKEARGSRHEAKTILQDVTMLGATIKAYEKQLAEAQTEATLWLAGRAQLIKRLLGDTSSAPDLSV